METIKCIYCNTEKSEDLFSLEHIFPTALGGKVITDNLFKTRSVCKECNQKLGLNTDGAFLKSFFIKNAASMDYLGYVDFDDDKYTLPFIFLGTNKSVQHPDYKYCDYWNWHGGSRVFHFHNNYSDTFNTYAGGNPIGHKYEERAGEAYLVASTNNPIWLKKLLFSFQEQFKKTKRYSVNINITNSNNFFHQTTEKEEKIIEEILKIANETQNNSIALQLGFEVKFLSKVALAIGYNLFGNNYLNSHYAQLLRTVLWENENSQLLEYKHKMSNFLGEESLPAQLSSIIQWKGGHTIASFPIGDKLLLLLYLSGSNKPFIVQITDEVTKFKHQIISKFPEGCVWILIPQRRIFKGPFGFPEYLAYKMGDKSFMEDLMDIEKLYVEFQDLPPFDIPVKEPNA